MTDEVVVPFQAKPKVKEVAGNNKGYWLSLKGVKAHVEEILGYDWERVKEVITMWEIASQASARAEFRQTKEILAELRAIDKRIRMNAERPDDPERQRNLTVELVRIRRDFDEEPMTEEEMKREVEGFLRSQAYWNKVSRELAGMTNEEITAELKAKSGNTKPWSEWSDDEKNDYIRRQDNLRWELKNRLSPEEWVRWLNGMGYEVSYDPHDGTANGYSRAG